jgi:hypothetical protein
MFAIIPMLIANPMVTAMISIRIISMTRQTRNNSQSDNTYTSTSAMLIESAAPWTIMGIPVIITAWLPNALWWDGVGMAWFAIGVGVFFLHLLLKKLMGVQLLSPQLVILRVAKGIAWNRNTSEKLSQQSTAEFISFNENTNADTENLMRYVISLT